MGAASIHGATVWEDAGVTLMARITGTDASNITQSDVSSIARKVYDITSRTPGTSVNSTTLTVANVVFDTLQTDSRWTKDSTGYNFRDTLSSTVCSGGGRTYQVEYKFTPASGQPYPVVYRLEAQSLYGS